MKEKTATHNKHNHITMSLEDVGMHHSLSVMLQVFPVVKRRENMAVITRNNRYCTHHWGMWKSGTHLLRWEEGENSNT